MTMQETIESKITQAFQPVFMQVENESHLHSGPASESHFKVTLVTQAFEGLPLIKRHRAVQAALAEEVAQIHALGLHTFTPAEFEAKGGVIPDSPKCMGGSKRKA
jgi:BolA protein